MWGMWLRYTSSHEVSCTSPGISRLPSGAVRCSCLTLRLWRQTLPCEAPFRMQTSLLARFTCRGTPPAAGLRPEPQSTAQPIPHLPVPGRHDDALSGQVGVVCGIAQGQWGTERCPVPWASRTACYCCCCCCHRRHVPESSCAPSAVVWRHARQPWLWPGRSAGHLHGCHISYIGLHDDCCAVQRLSEALCICPKGRVAGKVCSWRCILYEQVHVHAHALHNARGQCCTYGEGQQQLGPDGSRWSES